MKNKYLTIRIDEQTLEAAKKAAERDNRTLTSYIINLIKKDFEKEKK